MGERKEPPTELGRAVREKRDAADLSQHQLATLLGVSPATVYRIERGARPSQRAADALRRWCRSLPIDEVIP